MISYPTCSRCLDSRSELNQDGVCAYCVEKLSKNESLQSHVENIDSDPEINEVEEDEAGNPQDLSTLAGQQFTFNQSSQLETQFQLTNYRDLKYIDRGGMGLVFRAVQKNANRVVAIKMMNAIAQSDERQERRFRTEAEALARLSHPGIVQVYDVGHEKGISYFAMEYVAGGTLSNRLRTGPKLSANEAAELVASVASALAAAHGVGIIHRDIKPSNILLTEVGRPKLTDFGLAALADAETKYTQSGALIGTPSYMSPEQASGRFRDITVRSDVYSLGATLYETLTGRPPFNSDSPVTTAVKVMNQQVTPPRTIDPTIPKALERICLKCLEKNPLDRYKNAADLANDLSRFLRGETITAVPATLFQRTKRYVREHKRSVAAMLLLIACATAFGMLPESPEKKQYKTLQNYRVYEQSLDALGIPEVYKWKSASSKITKLGPKEYGFQTLGRSFLEICPDSVVDEFEFSGELKHIDIKNFNFSCIGFYICPYQQDIIEYPVNRIFLVYYSDFYKDVQGKIIDINMSQRAFGQTKLIYNQSIKGQDFASAELAQNTVQREIFETGLNSWRWFKMTVRKEKITIEMGDDRSTRSNKNDFDIKVSDFDKPGAKFPDQINAHFGGDDSVFKPWTTRSSMGFYAEDTTIGIRNIKITPLRSK